MACSAAGQGGDSDIRQTGRQCISASGLETEGVTNINKVNARLKAATPWYPIYGVEPAMVTRSRI